MRYKSDGSEVKVGDQVIVEGDVRGRVVCDLDHQQCLSGYEKWLTGKELLGGGRLSTGIIVETQKLGVVHFEFEDDIARDLG